MLRTIIWFIYFALCLPFTLPHLFITASLKKQNKLEESREMAHIVSGYWARSLVWLAGTKVSVHGVENLPQDKPVLFISNHQGNFDIPLLLGYVNKPKGFVAKIEILKMPIIRTWMKYMGCVFMDRNDMRQSLKTINEAAEHIKAGCSIVLFPEGTRSKSDIMGDFKPGSFKLASKAEATIVPVTIKGSYKIMEANGFIMKPSKVEIIIDTPIDIKGLNKDEISELPDVVRRIIQKNLDLDLNM